MIDGMFSFLYLIVVVMFVCLFVCLGLFVF